MPRGGGAPCQGVAAGCSSACPRVATSGSSARPHMQLLLLLQMWLLLLLMRRRGRRIKMGGRQAAGRVVGCVRMRGGVGGEVG